MPNVSDFVGRSYQRYSVGARFTVPEDASPPYDPGLVESEQGVVYHLNADGELIDVAVNVKGGLVTVTTDSNGQATVVFPEPFPVIPAAIVTTPSNQLISVGTLELTAAHVMIWAWDIPAGGWASDREINLYWIGLFD